MMYEQNGDKVDAFYGLPADVKFCKSCAISNQRPSSTVEIRHKIEEKKETINFDNNGICDACNFEQIKSSEIDWKQRELKLEELDIKSQAKSDLGVSGYFYFAHAYGYVDIPIQYILSEAVVGKLQIPAVVKSGNAVGVRFHPEKSGIIGLRFLAKFFETVPSTSAK